MNCRYVYLGGVLLFSALWACSSGGVAVDLRPAIPIPMQDAATGAASLGRRTGCKDCDVLIWQEEGGVPKPFLVAREPVIEIAKDEIRRVSIVRIGGAQDDEVLHEVLLELDPEAALRIRDRNPRLMSLFAYVNGELIGMGDLTPIGSSYAIGAYPTRAEAESVSKALGGILARSIEE